jgi:hypothetical protein
MTSLSSAKAILSVAVLAAAGIGFAGINPYLPGGGDNAAYIAEAESWLATGQRLRSYEAGTPPATYKPPLFPLLLVGVERLLGRNLAAMKAVLVLFAAAAVWAAWWTLRCGLEEGQAPGSWLLALESGAGGKGQEQGAKSQELDRAEDSSRQAALLAFWFALAPTLTLTAHDVLSDVPFTFLVLVAIGCTGRAARPQASWRALILPAALLTLATLMRTAGVLATGACAGYLGLSALLRWREACFRRLLLGCIVLAALAGALLWYQQRGERTYSHFITESIMASGQPGVGQASSLSGRQDGGPTAEAPRTSYQDSSLGAGLMRKLGFYCVFLPAEVGGHDGLGPASAVNVLAVIGCSLAATGLVTMLLRRQFLIPLCFLFLQAPLLFLPWFFTRYYLPALPLWLCLLWVGARQVLSGKVLSTERGPAPGSLSTQYAVLSTSAPLAALAFALCLVPSVSLCGTWLDLVWGKAESVTIVEWIAGPLALAALLLWAWLAHPLKALGSWLLALGPGAARKCQELRAKSQELPHSVLSTQYCSRRRILISIFGVFLTLAASRCVSENVVRERLAGPAPAGEGWRDFYDAACWLKDHAQPGEAVASDRISLVWFWAGLRGVPIPRTRDQAQAERQLRPAQWLIIDGLAEDQVAARYLGPFIHNAPDAWQESWHQNQTWVFRRKQNK